MGRKLQVLLGPRMAGALMLAPYGHRWAGVCKKTGGDPMMMMCCLQQALLVALLHPVRLDASERQNLPGHPRQCEQHAVAPQ